MSAVVDAAIRKALTDAPGLAALVPGGVHNTARPQGGAFPVVVFRALKSVEDQAYGGDGVERIPYDVKVITTHDKQAGVGEALRIIRAALNRVPLGLSEGVHLQTLSDGAIPPYPETAGSVTYVHKGRSFNVWASGVS